jgi:hemoglobin
MAEPSLYERLGGVFAIAAVIDHFSDAVVQNSVVGQASKNPELREWHTNSVDRLPGLKFMRTLWSATSPADPSRSLPRSREALPSGWKRPIASSTSPRGVR